MAPALMSALIALSALVLVACQPLLTPQPTVADEEMMLAVDSDEHTEVRTSIEGGHLVFDVFSETGIGNAQIALDEQPSDGVRLRLHVAGLEEFRLTYGATDVTASVSSSGAYDLRQHVAIDQDDAQPITPQSRYWLDIKALDGAGEPAAGITLENGYFQVTPSVDFDEGGYDMFSIAWIDFYR